MSVYSVAILCFGVGFVCGMAFAAWRLRRILRAQRVGEADWQKWADRRAARLRGDDV